MRFLWLLLFLSSCSNAQLERPIVDEELRPFKEEFSKLMNDPVINERLKKTEIYFDDMKTDKTNVIGQCSLWTLPYRTIRIDFKYWQRATPTNQQFTAFHELAHCVCYAAHTELSSGWQRFFERIGFALGIIERKGYLKDGCPASIMHPSDFNQFCMLKHYNYYMDELKQKCTKKKI